MYRSDYDDESQLKTPTIHSDHDILSNIDVFCLRTAKNTIPKALIPIDRFNWIVNIAHNDQNNTHKQTVQSQTQFILIILFVY